MWVALGHCARQAHLIQKCLDPPLRLCGSLHHKGLGQAISHGVAGVEAGTGVLEDDSHGRTRLLQRAVGKMRDVRAVMQHTARGRLDKAKDKTGEGGFPTTGFADDTDDIPPPD